MLSEIRIESLGAIGSAVAEFDRGLTVLTGETGTGKTMVVTGLHLLGGARADPARVRSGADRAVVEGRFTTTDVDGPVAADVTELAGFMRRGARRRRQRHRQPFGGQRRSIARLPRWPQRAGEVSRHLHHRAAGTARAERSTAIDATG